jgi:7-cyano-7-deazaguanine synthase
MRTLVLHSGGLDSTVLLYKANAVGEAASISLHYGQRHEKELAAASHIASLLGVPHVQFALAMGPILANSRSALVNKNVAVPEGHYEDESMKATVVPNRNMLLLATAAAYGIANGYDTLAYAAHAGDHAIYPDCRPKFIDAMAEALSLCDWNPAKLYTPFARLTKADIVKLGDTLDVPMSLTWSCYNGRERHCGRCGTCVERIEAFKLAGVQDRTLYEDVAYVPAH